MSARPPPLPSTPAPARVRRELEAMLTHIEQEFVRREGRAPRRVVLLGEASRELEALPAARRCGLHVEEIDDAARARLARDADVTWARAALETPPDVVVLIGLLEECRDPGAVIDALARLLPDAAWLAVRFNCLDAVPAAALRRCWRLTFGEPAALATRHVVALLSRSGYALCRQLAPSAAARLALFRRRPPGPIEERLSIVVPVFNEARSVARVLDTVAGKRLGIPKEIVVVESNSTDGSREIVRAYEGRDGLRVIYEDRPRGKGHAVRAGLRVVTGTIALIQDADLEYDVDDYDALIEPILQKKTTFVLGSRTLGVGGWRVREIPGDRIKGALLNAAQVVFAKTFNALYGERVTDVNTMFKVFRTECLDALRLESDGFDLDIELACKLVANGNPPLEVPVSYVARAFDDGKKIRFWRDSIPTYRALFKYRRG